jgi:hypothetical protein
MASFVESLLLFLIFVFAIFASLGAIQTIRSVNVGNCLEDANGTLQNCSLSNNDYKLLNNTYNIYAQTSSIQNYLIWLLLVVTLISAVMLFAKLRRKQ